MLQTILEEHKEAEVELIRHRMSRVSHNMPDTLYMIGSQKRSNTAPALFFAARGRLEQDDGPAPAQSSNKIENELDRYVRNRRTSEVNAGVLVDIYSAQVAFLQPLAFHWRSPVNPVTNGPQKSGRINGLAVLKGFLTELLFRPI